MLELTSQESDASENGNSKYSNSGNGSSRQTESIHEKRKDLADLAIWMSGLEATKLPLDDPHSLCNGRAFAELLHEIDKDFFDEKWLETMPETRSTSNLVIKRSNLRKLWRKMSDYVHILDRTITGNRWTDIGDRVDGLEETDLPVAVDLAMTVVVFALIGRNKEKYCEYSTNLSKQDPATMGNIVRMIGMVMTELAENTTFHEITDHESTHNELNGSIPESSNGNGSGERRRTLSNADQVLVDAQLEIDALRAEKENLTKEVNRLTKALEKTAAECSQLDTSISSESSDVVVLLEKQNEELKTKRRAAEERVLELEAAMEHFQTLVQKLTEENDTLQSGQKEFNMIRTHLDSAQSEVEEWRLQATKFQSDAELLKKKEKEVKDLQGQVKSLNSRLEHHVKTATIDEDNKAGIVQLRTQIGLMTANNVELTVALESKKRIVEQLEFQLIQQKEKVKELEDRKDDLITERNDLQNRLAYKEQVTSRNLHESMFDAGNLSFSDSNQTDFEIQRLKERIEELETLEPLQGEIKKMNSRNGVLEEENLKITKQKEELERQVAELEEKCAKSQQNASGDVVELKVQLEKAKVEVERMREAESRSETKLADQEALVKDYKQKNVYLEDVLAKSKEIIDELEEKNNSVGEDNKTSVQAFHELKEENEQLRVDNEKLKIMLETSTKTLEQENRLLTSAAYEMQVNRSVDEVMSMRASAGADEPQTLLETQKMNSALPYSLLILLIACFVAWMFISTFSAINAPPRA